VLESDPEGQKKAPKDRYSGSGGNECFTFPVISKGNEGMFPELVKRACFTCNAWPTWLGTRWLHSEGVRQ